MGHPKKSSAYPPTYLALCEKAITETVVLEVPKGQNATTVRTSFQTFIRCVVREGETPYATPEQKERSNWISKIQARSDVPTNTVTLESRDNSWYAKLAKDALEKLGHDPDSPAMTPEESLRRLNAQLDGTAETLTPEEQAIRARYFGGSQ